MLKRLTIVRGGRFELVVTLAGVDLDEFTPAMQLQPWPSKEGDAIEMSATKSDGTIVVTLGADVTRELPTNRTLYGRLQLQHVTDPAMDLITRTRYEFIIESSPTQRGT